MARISGSTFLACRGVHYVGMQWPLSFWLHTAHDSIHLGMVAVLSPVSSMHTRLNSLESFTKSIIKKNKFNKF